MENLPWRSHRRGYLQPFLALLHPGATLKTHHTENKSNITITRGSILRMYQSNIILQSSELVEHRATCSITRDEKGQRQSVTTAFSDVMTFSWKGRKMLKTSHSDISTNRGERLLSPLQFIVNALPGWWEKYSFFYFLKNVVQEKWNGSGMFSC